MYSHANTRMVLNFYGCQLSQRYKYCIGLEIGEFLQLIIITTGSQSSEIEGSN